MIKSEETCTQWLVVTPEKIPHLGYLISFKPMNKKT